MPSSRATAISALVSMVNVTRPSTSAGVSPASASAALHRLGGELQLAAAGVLGELGGADAGDRGLARQTGSCPAPPAVDRHGAGDVVAEAAPPDDVDGRSPSVGRSTTAPLNVSVSPA